MHKLNKNFVFPVRRFLVLALPQHLVIYHDVAAVTEVYPVQPMSLLCLLVLKTVQIKYHIHTARVISAIFPTGECKAYFDTIGKKKDGFYLPCFYFIPNDLVLLQKNTNKQTNKFFCFFFFQIHFSKNQKKKTNLLISDLVYFRRLF